MSELTFKDIINQVKCEAIPNIRFSQGKSLYQNGC